MKRSALRRGKPLRAKRKPDPIPVEVDDALRERSGGRCEVRALEHGCTSLATQRHHVLPRSHGGEHTLENLLHVCARGHMAVHLNPALSYALGYLRHSYDRDSVA